MAGKLEAAASGEERTEHEEASDQSLLSATVDGDAGATPGLIGGGVAVCLCNQSLETETDTDAGRMGRDGLIESAIALADCLRAQPSAVP